MSTPPRRRGNSHREAGPFHRDIGMRVGRARPVPRLGPRWVPTMTTPSFERPTQPTPLTCADRGSGQVSPRENAKDISFASRRSTVRFVCRVRAGMPTSELAAAVRVPTARTCCMSSMGP
jgi:hypothetical protein